MKRFLFFLSTLLVFIILGAFGIFFYLIQPYATSGPTQTFVINKGDSLKTIGQRLEKSHLIRSRFTFVVYAYFTGYSSRLQAGGFSLVPSHSVPEIIYQLSSGGSHDYWIKITEGWRLEEIAAYFEKNQFFQGQEFLHLARSYQGRVFPDSYLVPTEYDLHQFLNLTQANFNKKINLAKVDSVNSDFSEDQALVLASLLEREARTLPSKQMVSGIIQNRLRLQMPLQIDATVQYARDSQLPHPASYWRPVLKSDLDIKSPYNTYLQSGLPPEPICSPGYDSLYAAFHPTPSDYLYYITGNDNQMHYAKTLEEHNRNIQLYLN
jgi:UPF0755 protein